MTKLTKIIGAGILGLASLTSGCGELGKVDEINYYDNIERGAEFLEDKITDIVVYTRLGDRDGIDYKTFCEITGIEKNPDYSEELPVWVEITSLKGHGELLNGKPELYQGRVIFDIYYDRAGEVLSKLNKFRDDYRGIKPLTDEDFKNLPPGGY